MTNQDIKACQDTEGTKFTEFAEVQLSCQLLGDLFNTIVKFKFGALDSALGFIPII